MNCMDFTIDNFIYLFVDLFIYSSICLFIIHLFAFIHAPFIHAIKSVWPCYVVSIFGVVCLSGEEESDKD